MGVCAEITFLPEGEEHTGQGRQYDHDHGKSKRLHGDQRCPLLRGEHILQERIGSNLQRIITECGDKAACRHEPADSGMFDKHAADHKQRGEQKYTSIAQFPAFQNESGAKYAAHLHEKQSKPEHKT